METWTLFVAEEDQAHSECAGKAMAQAALRKAFNQKNSADRRTQVICKLTKKRK